MEVSGTESSCRVTEELESTLGQLQEDRLARAGQHTTAKVVLERAETKHWSKWRASGTSCVAGGGAEAALSASGIRAGMRGIQAEKQALQSRLAEQEDSINAARIHWDREKAALDALSQEAQAEKERATTALRQVTQRSAQLESQLETISQELEEAKNRTVRIKSERDKARFELDALTAEMNKVSEERAQLGQARDEALDQLTLFKVEREEALKGQAELVEARDQAIMELKSRRQVIGDCWELEKKLTPQLGEARSHRCPKRSGPTSPGSRGCHAERPRSRRPRSCHAPQAHQPDRG